MFVAVPLKSLGLGLSAMDSAVVYDDGYEGFQAFAVHLLYEVHKGILVDGFSPHYHVMKNPP